MSTQSNGPTATVALLLGLISSVNAFWRLPCMGIAGTGRLDPIVYPGEPSDHVHTIKGASAFSFSSSAADLLKSNCSSCEVVQDKSAYWTPALYFVDSNGTVEIVEELLGGHLTYYDYRKNFMANGTQQQVESFPNGFRMISGDTNRRNFSLPTPDPPLPWTGKDATQSALSQKAIGFNCLNYAGAAEPSLGRHFLPDKDFLDSNCPQGIRMELLFPACWNGELDSEDHQSHVAFPDSGLGVGTCPEGYDRALPTLFYETTWLTSGYGDRDGQFTLANGDATGHGYHGDFIAAWDEGVLQQALDQCGSQISSGLINECPVFDLRSEEDQQSCFFEMPAELSSENVKGPDSAIPGNVQIASGPAPASTGAPAVVASSAIPATSSIPKPTPYASPAASSAAMRHASSSLTTSASSAALLPSSLVTSPSSAALPSTPSPVPTSSSAIQPSAKVQIISSPIPTSAPSSTLPSDGNQNDLPTAYTTLITSDREAIDLVVLETFVTITEGNAPIETPALQHKRHIHRHKHQNVHHYER